MLVIVIFYYQGAHVARGDYWLLFFEKTFFNKKAFFNKKKHA